MELNQARISHEEHQTEWKNNTILVTTNREMIQNFRSLADENGQTTRVEVFKTGSIGLYFCSSL